MLNMIIGAVVIGVFWFVVNYVRGKNLQLTWWQWLLTILGLAFAGFTLATVTTLAGEYSPKAALVLGGMLGLITVIWGVLMARFVFLRAS